MKPTRGKSRDQKERKSDIGKKKEKCANLETDIKKMTTERMKLKNSDSQISRKRKRANSEMEETPPKDFDLKELSKKHILQCISAIFHLTQEQLKENNLLATETQPIFMQVTCVKIPKVPRRQMRILLPYSIVAPNDEIALFVCDLERGRRKDYEPTVEHYKNLLDEHGCTRVNEIIPINRVKTEFDQFELKKKLIGSYDHFLVDGRIAGHMSQLLGKYFIKRRKLPTSIKMDSKDLKHEIDYALRKTSMHLHSNGDTHLVQIGNTSMGKKEILKNILATCENLSKNYPGGWANIRALRLKSTTTLALPFYMTLKSKNTIDSLTIAVPPKRPRAYHDVEGELSTFLGNTTVTVKPDGQVILNKQKNLRNKKSIKKK
ncbi:ribosomal L1 domain-containing protein CG13096-like [Cataglyphis hispanica]|uniref:ribosomal L1 domain-containing protein CG13096-like n=1 Tax=Cataglyphis hispanica TaxID=1086592 RepID=UPI00217F3BA7|nr:ribosomal L1 domain-containing protein CG13096-like [Cataglyphis hispanica]